MKIKSIPFKKLMYKRQYTLLTLHNKEWCAFNGTLSDIGYNFDLEIKEAHFKLKGQGYRIVDKYRVQRKCIFIIYLI